MLSVEATMRVTELWQTRGSFFGADAGGVSRNANGEVRGSFLGSLALTSTESYNETAADFLGNLPEVHN